MSHMTRADLTELMLSFTKAERTHLGHTGDTPSPGLRMVIVASEEHRIRNGDGTPLSPRLRDLGAVLKHYSKAVRDGKRENILEHLHSALLLVNSGYTVQMAIKDARKPRNLEQAAANRKAMAKEKAAA